VPTVTSPAISPETIVRANGADLCAQTFGHLIGPAILLTLADINHELPRDTWGVVVSAILRHTST
jgi:hypothetical protein